ncbi:MAG: 30S ribosomal protein S13 [Candidatus Fischerbacteria bacterium RBG_13_37_8]|uniref:Small ribosomal subunit protein uS13 n=1 Tax=Candidatus Fischerbacteria bacterium RBG_13_37_8 TaxID=1817863 RepID=A0A1F5VE02_9BACT|nr:MAG: 30S ribosomal protein S13 [Candidatus Fischerbacteria bacterium RBG_13_37_8]
MARIAGVDLPPNKIAEVGLTYIYGVGRPRAKKILEAAGVPFQAKIKDLTEEQIANIRKIIESEGKVEGDLRKIIQMDVKRLIDIGCYRGSRHKLGLPVRGQRSHTNARTRKGPKGKTVALKRKTKKV